MVDPAATVAINAMVLTAIKRAATMTNATVHTAIKRVTTMTTAMVLTVIARAAMMTIAMVHIVIARVATATDIVQEAAATEEILITIEANPALTAAQETTKTTDILDTATDLLMVVQADPTAATPTDAPKPTAAAPMDAPKPMVTENPTAVAPTVENPMHTHGPIPIMVAESKDPTTIKVTLAAANLVPPLATISEE